MRLMDARDVASYLHISIDTVRRLTRSGELPCVQVGGRSIRYRPEQISAYLDGRERSHVAPATAPLMATTKQLRAAGRR